MLADARPGLSRRGAWINPGGSYVELSGGLFRIFVAESDVVPDPMLPAKDEQDAKPSGGINRGVRRACRSRIRAAALDAGSPLLSTMSRVRDIWHMGALLDAESLLCIAMSRLEDI